MKRMILFLLVLTLSSTLFARATYYNKEFQLLLSTNSTDANEWKNQLFKVTSYGHLKQTNGNDILVNKCFANNSKCEQHKVFSYEQARRYLFGVIDLQKDKFGEYFIEEVYCEKIIDSTDRVGPNQIPNSDVINCEHSWPRSKFNSEMSYEEQLSDLYHLYPTDSKANTTRLNYQFAEVVQGRQLNNCEISQIGMLPSKKAKAFEPPQNHKGNLARSLFYFSVRYKIEIPDEQEKFLRSWHKLDPVDLDEKERHEKIYGIQKNRNPFIDFEEIVDLINDF